MIRIGVDVGGTGIKAGLVDTDRGELVSERLRVKTPRDGEPEPVIAEIVGLVQQLGGEGTVGVGLPVVNSHGIVMTAANLSEQWVGVAATERLEQALGRRCVVMNDADAAGLAEMRFGVGKGNEGVVLMLTFGTGIGSALFVDGVLVPNLELGHIEVRGKDGERRAAASVRERKNLTWEEWAERVNEYLYRIDRLIWPDLIVMGGGVTKEAARFRHLLDCRPPLRIASLMNTAGIVGAAVRAADVERSGDRPLGGEPVAA